MAKQKVIVVGGGVAGFMATIKVGEAGLPVELFFLGPGESSPPVCCFFYPSDAADELLR